MIEVVAIVSMLKTVASIAGAAGSLGSDVAVNMGSEALCEVFEWSYKKIEEAYGKGKIGNALEQEFKKLDDNTLKDLEAFVRAKAQIRTKRKKVFPRNLKGKHLVDLFYLPFDSFDKLVDEYAQENNLPNDKRNALKLVLEDLRCYTTKVVYKKLQGKNNQLFLVIQQMIKDAYKDYDQNFIDNLYQTLFYRPTHCSCCGGPCLHYDEQFHKATCGNCHTIIDYPKSAYPDLLREMKDSLRNDISKIHDRLDKIEAVEKNIIDEIAEIAGRITSFQESIELISRLNIAQEYINNYDFDKAHNTCQEILKDFPDSVDAMWCDLQAEFGIVYVMGYGETVPKPVYCSPIDTSSKRRFMDHPHYKKILAMVEDDPERRKVYEARQKEIDRAIESVKSDLKRKQDYDVFICVKIGLAIDHTSPVDTSKKTVDFEKFAKDIYQQLTDKGKKVFCSQISRSQGVHYDQEIWSAMLRSKKMLVIGTRKDYLESVWVQCEWRRWLFLCNSGERSPNSFLALIPSNDWIDIRPLEWQKQRVTVYQDAHSVIEEIVRSNESIVTNQVNDGGIDPETYRGIQDVREFLKEGKIGRAKRRLKPLLQKHPSIGELRLLDLRIRSKDFKKWKKLPQDEIDNAIKKLVEDKEKNPEFLMYVINRVGDEINEELAQCETMPTSEKLSTPNKRNVKKIHQVPSADRSNPKADVPSHTTVPKDKSNKKSSNKISDFISDVVSFIFTAIIIIVIVAVIPIGLMWIFMEYSIIFIITSIICLGMTVYLLIRAFIDEFLNLKD